MTDPSFMKLIDDKPEDKKFADAIISEAESMAPRELVNNFNKKVFESMNIALDLFKRTCLNASNNKARAEASRWLLNFLKDPNFTRNLAVLQDIQKIVNKTTAPVDAKADWEKEPETEKK